MEKMGTGKTLVIAEKPSVGADIAKVLGCTKRNQGYLEGDRYIVTWAIGHLVGLKDAAEHDPSYRKWSLNPLPFSFDIRDSLKILPKTAAQYKVIKNLIHRSDVTALINAGDAGREGYLVQEWIYRMAGNRLPKKVLWASSFTEEALRKHFAALKDPRDFESLLEEAEARAEGDYALGINYSRALTMTIGGGSTMLIYGRCQTTLLNQIVLRDLEIEHFVVTPYYNIEARYEKGFTGLLIDGEKKRLDLPEKDAADAILTELSVLPAPVVEEYTAEDKKAPPPLLYNLAALQKAMGSRYGYPPEKTLSLAQSLYEKHKMISYPRTDSRVISTDVRNEISKHLNALYGIREYRPYLEKLITLFGGWGGKPRLSGRYVNDHKVTDHYAIIPTDAKNMGKEYETLTRDERNVFDAVAKVFMAMFMPDYEYKATTVIARTGEYRFLSRGKTTTKPGYKEIFAGESYETGKEDEKEEQLPPLRIGEALPVINYERLDKETKPPAHFTDNTIIAFMEKNNIGTSATRAEIIKKLQNPRAPYILRTRGHYEATKLGRDYIAVLPEELKELSLTQRFEESLQKINEGSLTKDAFLAALRDEQRRYIETFCSMPAVKADIPPKKRTTTYRKKKKT